MLTALRIEAQTADNFLAEISIALSWRRSIELIPQRQLPAESYDLRPATASIKRRPTQAFAGSIHAMK